MAICRRLLLGGFRLSTILAELLPVLPELLEILLQLSLVARGQVGFDLLQIGLELLTGLLLLAIVVVQGLTVFCQAAPILLNLLVSGLGGGTRRS